MINRCLVLAICGPLLFGFGLVSAHSQAGNPTCSSSWVYRGPGGKLIYRTSPRGDQIMDFSSAGYRGGGEPLPAVPIRRSVSPSGEDDTGTIQAAVDEVSRLALSDGFRGAILLKPGLYHCSRTLRLAASGIVLRGSGSGTEGTVINMTGAPHLAILISGQVSLTSLSSAVPIQDRYVPAGAVSLTIEPGTRFAPGELALVSRPVTADWVHFMGMDTLFRDGRKETWLSVGSRTTAERTIKAVEGNRLTFDTPLSDAFDSAYLNPSGATVTKIESSGHVTQVGLESLRLVAPPQVVTISEPHHQGIRLRGAADCWVRDISLVDTVNSVAAGRDCLRVTVQQVRITHSVATKGAAKPADFSTEGSQILFRDCSGRGSNLFYFVTGARVTGPNVLLNCVFQGNGHIQPHARWATGLLIDNCQVPEGGIDLMNRGEMGSGHGWTVGWSVAWNCAAKTFIIQQPPGAMNWAIGCRGIRSTQGMPFGHLPDLPEGIYDSPGARVVPESLYAAQLAERLGPAVLKTLGY